MLRCDFVVDDTGSDSGRCFAPLLTRTRDKQGICLLVLAFLGVWAVELTGILTGWPFGSYEYTARWQPLVQILGKHFPVALPFAWLLIAGASAIVCSKLRLAILCGALLATAIDFEMEPVMTGPLGYWHWAPRGPLPGGASFMNPVGWFLTSCFVGMCIRGTKVGFSREAGVVLVGHVALVLGLGAIAWR